MEGGGVGQHFGLTHAHFLLRFLSLQKLVKKLNFVLLIFRVLEVQFFL